MTIELKQPKPLFDEHEWEGILAGRAIPNDMRVGESLTKYLERVVVAQPEKVVPDRLAFNGWYCAHCQTGVDGSEVTFNEQHTVCGRVITNDEPPTKETLAAPELPDFAKRILAKLTRFHEQAEDSDSGGTDIGTHWLEMLTMLGLLNRVQRSPARWEVSQQGEDLLGQQGS